jgi:hypothetical protein
MKFLSLLQGNTKMRCRVYWAGDALAYVTRIFLIVMVSCELGCQSQTTGPATTDTSSSSLTTLSEKIEFLERYVTFRRSYQSLEFHINYHNNGGGLVPGPSDWDIRLIAQVPAAELPQWIPPGIASSNSSDQQWLSIVPTANQANSITEWYIGPGTVVGIDRWRAIVVYRRWTL